MTPVGGENPVGLGVIRDPRHRAGSPRHSAPPGSARLFLRLLLASLAMLFVASIVGFVVIDISSPQAEAPSPAAEALPPWLWVGTAVLAASSVTMEAARRSARRGDGRLTAWMTATTLLGVLFVALQALSWMGLAPAIGGFRGLEVGPEKIRAVQFVFLTGLHAAHVLGGLVALAWVGIRAGLGHYSAAWHPGVDYSATYWHFLAVVWLALLATLVVTF